MVLHGRGLMNITIAALVSEVLAAAMKFSVVVSVSENCKNKSEMMMSVVSVGVWKWGQGK